MLWVGLVWMSGFDDGVGGERKREKQKFGLGIGAGTMVDLFEIPFI